MKNVVAKLPVPINASSPQVKKLIAMLNGYCMFHNDMQTFDAGLPSKVAVAAFVASAKNLNIAIIQG